MSSSPVLSATVLGKRKAVRNLDVLVLHLASPRLDLGSEYQSEFTTPRFSTPPPIIANGTLIPNTKKCYQCTYDDCDKSYSKPSRLEEHVRSHTGQRPFVCVTCKKSYLRETHLQAHARSHLPASDRPFTCQEEHCDKRFWTSQHLRVHSESHKGAKPFKCSDPSCIEAFAKHHQLRSHTCQTHAPPGTKPYRCNHEGCIKSFSTNQKLRTHLKVHDVKRYTCVHPTCLPISAGLPIYYPTWTALQHHLRTVHPPTCSHPSCNNRIFSSQKGLRAHQKLHEHREIEAEWYAAAVDSGDDGPSRKKRRGGNLGRDWKCEVDGCEKDFKSKKALTTHHQVTHLGRRDHVCPHDSCKQPFGYSHLLRRHLGKSHLSPKSASGSDSSGEDVTPTARFRMDIDAITGQAYAARAREQVLSARAFQCPYPHMDSLVFVVDVGQEGKLLGGSQRCEYVFSRAYDLRRHLGSAHGAQTEKGSLDQWVKDLKRVGV